MQLWPQTCTPRTANQSPAIKWPLALWTAARWLSVVNLACSLRDLGVLTSAYPKWHIPEFLPTAYTEDTFFHLVKFPYSGNALGGPSNLTALIWLCRGREGSDSGLTCPPHVCVHRPEEMQPSPEADVLGSSLRPAFNRPSPQGDDAGLSFSFVNSAGWTRWPRSFPLTSQISTVHLN